MKKLSVLAARFPRYFIAASIIAGSLVIFCLWLFFRGDGSSGSSNSSHASGASSSSGSGGKINLSELVLCGNTLVNYHSGEIVARQWLEGFGDELPPIARIYPDENFLIAVNRGGATAFSFGGKAGQPLTVEGKPLGRAAFSIGSPHVVYVNEGDLWKGAVDWVNSNIRDGKRVTDVGYFRDNTFSTDWFWTGDHLFVPVLGRTHKISLDTGAVNQERVQVSAIARGISPDGQVTIVDAGGRQMGVVDFAAETSKAHRVPNILNQVFWLDGEKAVLLIGRTHIAIYDRAKDELTAVHAPEAVIEKMLLPSPGGKRVLISTNRGLQILEVETGSFTPIPLPVEQIVWVSDDALMCSNNQTNSEARGVWIFQHDGEKERLSNRPVDAGRAFGASMPMVSIPGGGLFVSGGNLWSYDGASNTVRQLTQDEQLKPLLRLLGESESYSGE